MLHLHKTSLVAAMLIFPGTACALRAQVASVPASAPTLITRDNDLPMAPEPQARPSSPGAQAPQTQGPPSLQDLGIPPEQTRADLDAQHRLDVRSHDLKVHQTLGLVTQRNGSIAISASAPRAELTIWVRVGVTTLLLVAALWVILSRQYPSDEQKWAFGVIGTIIGYWLKG